MSLNTEEFPKFSQLPPEIQEKILKCSLGFNANGEFRQYFDNGALISKEPFLASTGEQYLNLSLVDKKCYGLLHQPYFKKMKFKLIRKRVLDRKKKDYTLSTQIYKGWGKNRLEIKRDFVGIHNRTPQEKVEHMLLKQEAEQEAEEYFGFTEEYKKKEEEKEKSRSKIPDFIPDPNTDDIHASSFKEDFYYNGYGTLKTRKITTSKEKHIVRYNTKTGKIRMLENHTICNHGTFLEKEVLVSNGLFYPTDGGVLSKQKYNLEKEENIDWEKIDRAFDDELSCEDLIPIRELIDDKIKEIAKEKETGEKRKRRDDLSYFVAELL
jgi:hypothetical protein